MQSSRTSASHVILCFNSGSSSMKFAFYRLGAVGEVQLAYGTVERIDLAGGHLWSRARTTLRWSMSSAIFLLKQPESEPHAAQTIELFCYQLRKHIGALTVVLGGLGERTAPVRWEVCRGLAYLGIDLDPQRNAVHAEAISTPRSACMVRVILTTEDLMIARHTLTLLVSTAVLYRLQTAENRVSI
jgi:acetate kinase